MIIKVFKYLPQLVKTSLNKPRFLLFKNSFNRTTKVRSWVSLFSFKHLLYVWGWEILWACSFNMLIILACTLLSMLWDHFLSASSWAALAAPLLALSDSSPVSLSSLPSLNLSSVSGWWDQMDIKNFNSDITNNPDIIKIEYSSDIGFINVSLGLLIWIGSNVLRDIEVWKIEWLNEDLPNIFTPGYIVGYYTFYALLDLLFNVLGAFKFFITNYLPDTIIGENFIYWYQTLIEPIFLKIKSFFSDRFFGGDGDSGLDEMREREHNFVPKDITLENNNSPVEGKLLTPWDRQEFVEGSST